MQQSAHDQQPAGGTGPVRREHGADSGKKGAVPRNENVVEGALRGPVAQKEGLPAQIFEQRRGERLLLAFRTNRIGDHRKKVRVEKHQKIDVERAKARAVDHLVETNSVLPVHEKVHAVPGAPIGGVVVQHLKLGVQTVLNPRHILLKEAALHVAERLHRGVVRRETGHKEHQRQRQHHGQEKFKA